MKYYSENFISVEIIHRKNILLNFDVSSLLSKLVARPLKLQIMTQIAILDIFCILY